MHYRIGEPHGLAHDPFKSLVVPRPIGWISSIDRAGRVNLAPFTFYNAVSSDPPIVMFAPGGFHRDGGLKDSVRNVRETGEFVVNVVTYDLRDAMNATSVEAPRGTDEMVLTGLAAAPSLAVTPPRVAVAPAALECVYLRDVEFPSGSGGGPATVIFGRVVAIHIVDDLLADGLVDVAKMGPIARLGGYEYATVDSVFAMRRPSKQVVPSAPRAAVEGMK